MRESIYFNPRVLEERFSDTERDRQCGVFAAQWASWLCYWAALSADRKAPCSLPLEHNFFCAEEAKELGDPHIQRSFCSEGYKCGRSPIPAGLLIDLGPNWYQRAFKLTPH